MSQSGTTSVREARFELRSRLVGFVHAHVKPTRHNEAPRTKCFEQRRKRIASGIRFERLLCLCALSSFFFLMRVHAVDPSLRISQYGHTVWRVQDGMVASYTPITQTADGYIWMASTNKESLLRFDGSQFVPWLPPKGNPLPGKISFLLGTRDGSLWIGTRGGLSRLKDGQLSRYTKASDKFGISVMIEDHAGKIWLTRYRSPKGEGGLCEVGERGLRCYGPSDGVVARYGVGLAEDASGSLWFATENLDRWRPGTQAVEYFNSVEHPQLVDVAVDHSGDVWATMSEVGPKFGVRYFHNGIWSEYVAAGFHSSTLRAETLFVDSAGAVWIGTPTGTASIAFGRVSLTIFPKLMGSPVAMPTASMRITKEISGSPLTAEWTCFEIRLSLPTRRTKVSVPELSQQCSPPSTERYGPDRKETKTLEGF